MARGSSTCRALNITVASEPLSWKVFRIQPGIAWAWLRASVEDRRIRAHPCCPRARAHLRLLSGLACTRARRP
eukprot:14451757-Alexandrium_andersonii.AAC.1